MNDDKAQGMTVDEFLTACKLVPLPHTSAMFTAHWLDRNLSVAERIALARSGKCPVCGSPSAPCEPKRVHPETPDGWECYGCTRCDWCVSVCDDTTRMVPCPCCEKGEPCEVGPTGGRACTCCMNTGEVPAYLVKG